MPGRPLLVWLLLAAVSLPAQAPAKPPGTEPAGLPDLGAPAAPPEGAPPHLTLIDRQGLRQHAYWLADDAREGRYTTGKGQQATAKYIAEHFQRLGLRPLGDKKGFLQHYPLQRVQIDKATAFTFGEHKVDSGFTVLESAPELKLTLAGRFLWCGNGSPSQVPEALGGRIPVVVLGNLGSGRAAGSDLQVVQRYLDIGEQLHKRGAAAGIVCLLDDQGTHGNTLNVKGLQFDHPRLRFQNGGGGLSMRASLFVLSAARSKQLLQHLGVPLGQDGAPTGGITDEKATGKLVLAVSQDEKATGSNVVAVLDGKGRKAEAIVISAHHDHVGKRLDGDIFNGADDNASGSAGLLELAEAFAKGGARPERSIVFLSVSGEELGLWGSDWYGQNPTWPLDKIVANVNIDMIGRAGTGEAIEMQVTPSHQHEKYSTIARDGVALGAKFGITFTSGDTYYERSDHYNFAKRGVPVVFFCDGEHPDYLQVSDTADRLDYRKMEAIARLAFWTAWNVAMAKGRPEELGKQAQW
jgi:hypothetical protein